MYTLVKNEKDKYRGHSINGIVSAILKSYYPLNINTNVIISEMNNKVFGKNHAVQLSEVLISAVNKKDDRCDFIVPENGSGIYLKVTPTKVGKEAINTAALHFLNRMLAKFQHAPFWCSHQHVSILNDEFDSFITDYGVLQTNVSKDIRNALRAQVFKKLETLKWLEFQRDEFRFNF